MITDGAVCSPWIYTLTVEIDKGLFFIPKRRLGDENCVDEVSCY